MVNFKFFFFLHLSGNWLGFKLLYSLAFLLLGLVQLLHLICMCISFRSVGEWLYERLVTVVIVEVIVDDVKVEMKGNVRFPFTLTKYKTYLLILLKWIYPSYILMPKFVFILRPKYLRTHSPLILINISNYNLFYNFRQKDCEAMLL